jgi:antitoxin (DNA-binding transcriptional repressor) of toxin-antitoxin stability system
MKSINIAKLKNNLSAVLSRLKSTGSITVYDRTSPIAVIYPYQPSLQDSDPGKKMVEKLAKEGAIKLGASSLDDSFFKTAPTKLLKKIDAVKLLIDDRGDR